METYCAVAAAFAAASRALRYTDSGDYKALADSAAASARLVYEASLLVSTSYTTQFPEVASFWPSDGQQLQDDRLLAAAVMLYAFSENRYWCAPSLHSVLAYLNCLSCSP